MDNNDNFICYLDILGFKKRIKDKEFQGFYQYLIDEVIKPYDYDGKVYLLSDSIIVISNDFSSIASNIFSIYSSAFNKSILIRGGLTKGSVNIPSNIQESGNKVIIPYLGKAFIKAVELERSINCAAICVDNNIEFTDEMKGLIFEYREIFPKSEKEYETKKFLVRGMRNPSEPATILAILAREISNLPKHEIPKFINTFCLYYKFLRRNQADNIQALKYWGDLLEQLISNYS